MNNVKEKTSLEPGLYEQVVSRLLEGCIAELHGNLHQIEIGTLDDGDSHDVLAEYLQQVVRQVLSGCRGEGRVQQQVDLFNRVISLLAQSGAELGLEIGFSQPNRADELIRRFFLTRVESFMPLTGLSIDGTDPIASTRP